MYSLIQARTRKSELRSQDDRVRSRSKSVPGLIYSSSPNRVLGVCLTRVYKGIYKG